MACRDRWFRASVCRHTERGISYWTKNYRTAIEAEDELALSREYPYYDPIYMLPESGQAWWRASGSRQAEAGIVSLADAVG